MTAERSWRRHWLLWPVLGLLLVLAGLWVFERSTGTALSVRYGSLLWIPVNEHTAWLPKPIKLALHSQGVSADPGPIAWRPLRNGFEVAELPVLVQGAEVDRILLTRIDPTKYRFMVRNDPTGRRHLDSWMRDLGAILVINGSYYGRSGAPATPVVIDGRPAGPAQYDAKQGAFVAAKGSAQLVDLQRQDWASALRGADAAMVSYPLLIASDGADRAPPGTGWLANRSFIAEDRAGRIILGTTKNAFFSLERLGAFLKRSPLELKLALDLDGGPVACQAVKLANYSRRQCGNWELQIDRRGQAKILPPFNITQPSMPMALAVVPR